MQLLRKIKLELLKHPRFRRFFFSFFFRLFLLDFKKNHVLVIFWILFFGFITYNIATPYGVAFLFLGPEYLNEISWVSYFIIGFSCGGFIMSYNMSSYIKNGFRFPFLATLKNPFMKFCLNNFILPLSFLILYIIQIIFFLLDENTFTIFQICTFILSFLVGTFTFIVISISYFIGTGRVITRSFNVIKTEGIELKHSKNKVHSGNRNQNLIKDSRDWYVETYFASPFKIRLVRSVRHYKKEVLKAVIKQYHKAAFVFQMITITSLVALGIFSNVSVFEIPAGASVFLLFSVFIMLLSSFYTWFRGWSGVVFVIFLLLFNFLYKSDKFSIKNKAYGLNYSGIKASYSYENFNSIDSNCIKKDLRTDIENTIEILEKWKTKNTPINNPSKKPKLVLINTSGGGLRSSLWTLFSLQYTDSLSGGKLLDHIQLITGSSGGMVGAAYLRELYFLHQKNKLKSYYGAKYRTNISKDILNPITFTIATNEWLPLKKYITGGKSYLYDRGTAFEERLKLNTEGVFYKRLENYKLAESNAYIPMMVFTPSIVNDGRKLMISPIGISYLTQNIETNSINYNALYGPIEYSRFFKKQDAANTQFTSVLRMSATFPYISPIVSLPSEPRIEVMDAGLRDNYGLETSLKFIKVFNDWIAENTSGVLIIQIRDKHKVDAIEDNPSQTLIQSLMKPSGKFYSNLFQIQDFNQNDQIQMADTWCKTKIDVIDLQLHNDPKDRISLSWHLTEKEKKKVIKSILLPENQAAIKKIIELIQ